MNRNEAIQRWERSLATLSDSVFLDIAHTYLGSVQTPFHKPVIIKQLTTLFCNETFLERLFSLISPLDAKILTATWLLFSATQDELCLLFSDELSYGNLQQAVVNLEERLLLIPDPDNPPGGRQLVVHPLLVDRMVKSVFSLDAVLDFKTIDYPVQPEGPDRRMVRALLSLYAQEKVGSLDKAIRFLQSDAATNIFSLWPKSYVADILTLLHRMCLDMEVIREDKQNILLYPEHAARLLSFSTKELQFHLLLAALHDNPSIVSLKDTESAIRSFFSFLCILIPDDVFADDTTYRRSCIIAAKHSGIRILQMDVLFRILELIGVKPTKIQEKHDSEVRLKPTIDSDFTISFSNDIEPVDGLDLLYLIALVKKVDTVSSYELSKESIAKALHYGLSIAQIRAYLKALTSYLPPNLATLFDQWETEFAAIRIYDGIIVHADERISRIIEALPALQSHIICRIEKGLYLFSRQSERVWRNILVSAGVGMLGPSIAEELPLPPFRACFASETNDYPVKEFAALLERIPKEQRTSFSSGNRQFLEELRTQIEKKGGQEELLSRLNRSLILLPSQISTLGKRNDIVSASGFDFQGKLNLCKAAVHSSSDILELHLSDQNGQMNVLLANAQEMIGSGKEAALRLTTIPEGVEKIVAVEKIFLVKKLRRSIFFSL